MFKTAITIKNKIKSLSDVLYTQRIEIGFTIHELRDDHDRGCLNTLIVDSSNLSRIPYRKLISSVEYI